ncbi:cupin [Denitratisoma sp. DHT3]|uniref:cupin domain-containing protein n=1 Tax=Denitratisoma sp. DHT3 TaxID=1981880 RepID=UPI001198697D|nr:cupin domain-containing protein [Denitratisoma sp. DHT3]QDX81403.1 cupin [Denitratisoma sp. DHT3]
MNDAIEHRGAPAAAGNLLQGLPAAAGGREAFEELLARPGLRIERIVSTGQASPPGFWYDQPDGEWVLLLSGRARLWLEGEASPRCLAPGDWIDLPPHCRHRVDWTDPDQPTVWLAVHYEMGIGAGMDPAGGACVG